MVLFVRYAIGVGVALLAVQDIGGLDALKEDEALAVDTPDAYTCRVKGKGIPCVIASLARFYSCLTVIFLNVCCQRQIVLDI